MTKLEKLRKILREQIDYYNENKEDTSLVYDTLCDVFCEKLDRGDYIEIIEALL